MERHIFLWTVVSVGYYYSNIVQRSRKKSKLIASDFTRPRMEISPLQQTRRERQSLHHPNGFA